MDLKWPEIPLKVNFGHPKCEFRTSKMAPGSHFVNKIHKNKKCGIDLKWQEVIFGHPKWLPAAI